MQATYGPDGGSQGSGPSVGGTETIGGSQVGQSGNTNRGGSSDGSRLGSIYHQIGAATASAVLIEAGVGILGGLSAGTAGLAAMGVLGTTSGLVGATVLVGGGAV